MIEDLVQKLDQWVAFVVAISPVLLNLLCFLVGMLFGHRLALVRDKRKEFNALAGPVRQGLGEQLKMVRTGRRGDLVDLQRYVLDQYLVGFAGLKPGPGAFGAAVDRYEKAYKACSPQYSLAGPTSFDPQALRELEQAIEALMPMLELKK